MHELIRRANSSGAWVADITPANAGWGWAGLRVIDLLEGERVTVNSDGMEFLVLPLSGACNVRSDDKEVQLLGRTTVFDAVTDFAYVGLDGSAEVVATVAGRFAFPSAKATKQLPFRYQPREAVAVELRGAGTCSRQVNNFCTPDTFEADRLIACEVLTPGGNWSSFPPHKHDEERDGEAALEEIYYYEIADGPSGKGAAYQRVYGDVDRPIDILAEVRSGDSVLIPYGWHGPSMAMPGYNLYYLNVMAGPGSKRAWEICDDPAHAWIRGTWPEQQVDSRLPMTH